MKSCLFYFFFQNWQLFFESRTSWNNNHEGWITKGYRIDRSHLSCWDQCLAAVWWRKQSFDSGIFCLLFSCFALIQEVSAVKLFCLQCHFVCLFDFPLILEGRVVKCCEEINLFLFYFENKLDFLFFTITFASLPNIRMLFVAVFFGFFLLSRHSPRTTIPITITIVSITIATLSLTTFTCRA